MRLFVVSDMHIGSSQDPLYTSLNNLVGQWVQTGDVLVLAGDIFDVFVGNKEVFINEYSRFFETVKLATERGVKIHYIEGNHDFLLKGAFSSCPEVQIHGQSVEFEFDQKKFFIAHGDLANRQDYGYRFLRALLRSLFLKVVVFLVPGKMVRAIGRKSSKYSSQITPRMPNELPIERRERLRGVYRSYAAEKLSQGFDFVIMGHCHDLDEKIFKIGSRLGQYVNVGYPRMHGSLLSWHSGDAKIGRERLP